MDCILTLERLLYSLNSAIKRTEERLTNAPSGQIIVREHKGIVYYYRNFENMREEYISKDKEALIKALAQKRYDQRILSTFQHEKAIIERTLETIKCNARFKSEEQIWQNFPDKLKPYVAQDPITHEGTIQEWENRTWRFKKETSKYKYISLKGERVRSKSECLIADRLFTAGIPYHYEEPLPLGPSQYGQVIIYPDFAVLNPKTLKVYYWEHMGKLGDEEYAVKAKYRLEQYADAEYFLGKDLIISFETNTSPLNLVYIDRLIQTYFA